MYILNGASGKHTAQFNPGVPLPYEQWAVGGSSMHIDLVIDADGHCNEPWEDLTPWMPKEYHHPTPTGTASSPSRCAWWRPSLACPTSRSAASSAATPWHGSASLLPNSLRLRSTSSARRWQCSGDKMPQTLPRAAVHCHRAPCWTAHPLFGALPTPTLKPHACVCRCRFWHTICSAYGKACCQWPRAYCKQDACDNDAR